MRSELHNKVQDSVVVFYRKRGWVALKEHYMQGKKIDVLVQHMKTKYTIANEVQLSPRHFLENIILDLRAGCDEVRIISIDTNVSQKITELAQKRLCGHLLKRVRFQTADEFNLHLNNNNLVHNAEFNEEDNPEDNPEERR
jgi:hypothetical protein